MKHYLPAALIIIAAAMVSCQKEQSELTLDSMPSSAVITGTVEYVTGDYELDGAIISNYRLPLSGQTVMVTVPNGDYASQAEGNQYFETVTDENGNYRIEIPVSYGTLNASVDVLPFYAPKTLMQGNSTVQIENALYNNTEAGDNTPSISNISIQQKKIYSVNLVVSSDARLPVEINKEITVAGKVQVQAWKVTNSELNDNDANYYGGDYNSYEADITITAVVKKDNDETRITMNTASLSDGEFSETMLLPSDCLDANVTTTITAEVKDHLGKPFRHRYYISSPKREWQSMDVEVLYNGSKVSGQLTNDLIPLDLGTITITTDPIEDIDNIWGIGLYGLQDGNYIEYNNPFNW